MKIKRTTLMRDSAVEFIYTTAEGEYLGRARFEALDRNGMKLMAQDALDFVAEQQAEEERPKIALAVAASLRGN